MVEQTAEHYAQRAFDLNLLDARQLEAVWSECGTRDVAAGDFLNLLVRRELLTNYQVERLKRAERTGFFYGDYKVLYLVGTGSFARVYRAVHRDTGKIVAVKVLRRRFSDDRDQKEQFLREGKMGISLRHPNIVPIYAAHSQSRFHYIVMDFVEGRNLRDFLKIRRKLSAKESTRIISEVVEGLSYAFARGITHRDLKLSNVLVSSVGRAQLVDFGLAAGADNLTDDKMADCPNPRTIDYAALERATGVRKDDPRSDIYFAGCIYYHMISGEPPLYETTDRIQRLSVSRFQEIVPITQLVPDLPTAVSIVVNKSMELKPSRRYQSPADMLQDLKKAAQRLDAGGGGGEPETGAEVIASGGEIAPRVNAEGVSRTVMVVEPNMAMQNVFRERLKKYGYRVLVMSDPSRALDRLAADPCPADCVVFSARELGRASIDAYNMLGTLEATKNLPALLLLDTSQQAWKEQAKSGPRRDILSLPIKLKELRLTLRKLIELDRSATN